jgi:hypothetical protein
MLLYGFVLQLTQRLSPSLLIATFIDRSLVEMAVDIVTWRSLRCQDSTTKKLRSRLLVTRARAALPRPALDESHS